MSYCLLWVSALAACLLWVAMFAAWMARIGTAWARRSLMVVIVLIPFFELCWIGVFPAILKFAMGLEDGWFGFVASLIAAYVIGCAVILRQASRRMTDSDEAAAQRWPAIALTVFFGAAIGATDLIYQRMDRGVQARMAPIIVQNAQRYAAALGPARIPPDQNAGPLYEAAIAKIGTDPLLGAGDYQSEQLPAAADPAAAELLARRADALALFRRAAALPECRFSDVDVNHVPGMKGMFPDLKLQRRLADLAALNVGYELAHGRTELAVADDIALRRMGQQMAQGPSLVAWLVGASINNMALMKLQDVLAAVKSADQLQILEPEASGAGRESLKRDLQAEECCVVSMMMGFAGIGDWQDDSLSQLPESTKVLLSATARMRYRVCYLDQDVEVYLEVTRAWRAALEQPFFQSQAALSELDRLRGSAVASRGVMARVLLPPTKSVVVKAANDEAIDSCSIAAIAATRYRLANGVLPSDLDQLVPAYLSAVPLDPFDGKPLRLARHNGQWIVYSIGQDLTDDGGGPTQGNKGDIPFVLRESAATTQGN